MIDKKIEEAAKRHMLIEYNEGDFPVKISEIKEQCESDFKAGANWAIKEFLKDLWHDTSEEPEKNKLIIEEYLDEFGYDYEMDCPTYSCRTWVEMVKIYDIKKWCYLDDILPKKGGEE